MKAILPLDAAHYRRHPIHGEDRIWAETNCYVDVWIELLHAFGLEPIAALPFTVGIDFEGDQWTFFKFPLADIYDLYGLDVQELAIWRPLTTHIEEQVTLGRPVLVELDSFHLPDTAGTAYQRAHTKSTVAVNAIDPAQRYLGYFHGQAYYELRGDDFAKLFRLDAPPDPNFLPPYVEIVKRHRQPLEAKALVEASIRLLRAQLARLPASNPFVRFKTRFQVDLQWLGNESIETFHLYSFATLRQFGACYELAATYLRWLERETATALAKPIGSFTNLSTSAKTLQFHLARAMARKKMLDVTPFDVMASTLDSAIEDLRRIYG